MTTPDVRTGMPEVKLGREEFARRYREQFFDPAFAANEAQIAAIIETAWDAYDNSARPAHREGGCWLC